VVPGAEDVPQSRQRLVTAGPDLLGDRQPDRVERLEGADLVQLQIGRLDGETRLLAVVPLDDRPGGLAEAAHQVEL
jgi:hypothetical protein